MKTSLKKVSCAVLLALASQTLSADSFVVRDIEVRGLQRVELGTFFTYLPVKVGEQVDDVRIPQIIRSLYRTGSFDSVKLFRDGEKLIVAVEERPTISSLTFDGNKQIKTEQLTEALKKMGFAKGEVLNPSMLSTIVREMEQQYYSHGKYGVRINHKVVRMPRNRVDVRFDIKEGDAATIAQINIVGNTVFTDAELTEQFELTTGSWLSFFTDDNQYAKEKLSGDLEKLRSHYMDRGYLKFNVTSTQVAISPERDQVFITINIEEGEPYTIRDIKFTGEMVLTEEQLQSMVPLKAGDTYSAAVLTWAETGISKLLGLYGYAFPNIVVVPDPDDSKKDVGITIMVDPGKRTYVRRINISGNETTNDHVLRREMRMMEGGGLSTDVVERSKTLLERLPYMEEVKIETPKVEGEDDLVDVEVKVKERNAGSFNIGFGYSSFYKLTFQTSVSHDNFMGTGNRVGFNINTSRAMENYSFSYTDPYFTVDGISAGGSIFYRSTDYAELGIAADSLSSYGGRFNIGFPISEVSRISLGAGYSDNEFTVGNARNVLQLNEFFDYVGHDSSRSNNYQYTLYTLEAGYSRNTLNRGVFPDRGTLHQFGVEASVPGSEFEFYKINYDLQHYIPIAEGWSVLLRGSIAYGDGYGQDDRLPYFEHFYAGGQGTVRGFERNAIGPRQISRFPRCVDGAPPTDPNDNPIFQSCSTGSGIPLPGQYDEISVQTSYGVGGNAKVLGGIELIFPTPMAQNSRSVRTSLFIDFGHVWDTKFDRNKYSNLQAADFARIPDYGDPGQFRASFGLGLQWLSPMGPIGFHFSRPIRKEDGDETENFGFTIGRTF